VIADESGTVVGTQFHPEKSGEVGLRILRNFVELCADRSG
jgi:glutamine amidotransferase